MHAKEQSSKESKGPTMCKFGTACQRNGCWFPHTYEELDQLKKQKHAKDNKTVADKLPTMCNSGTACNRQDKGCRFAHTDEELAKRLEDTLA